MAKKPNKIKTLERKKGKEKINKSSNNYSKDFVEEKKKNEPLHIVSAVPVIEEDFSVSKKTVIENVKVEKKWNTTTKKIEVPISFEEVYINGKDLKSYREEDKGDDILSELNKRIIKSYEDMDDAQKKQYSILEKNESKREVVSLLYNVDDDNRINIYNDITNTEEKKVIPILGEEIIVNKRIVKLGELILAKNKVTENQKIAVDTIKEKATIRYPDGNTENL
jgi:stress response protein YsnF